MNVLIVRKRETFKSKASRITLPVKTETCSRQNKACTSTVPTENPILCNTAVH